MNHYAEDGRTLVLRAVRKLLADPAGGPAPLLIIEEVDGSDWASATFAGRLHRLKLRIEGEAGAVAAAVERLNDRLGEVEATLGGHLLAQAAVVEKAEIAAAGLGPSAWRLSVDALTLID